jgi:hypothetical protein
MNGSFFVIFSPQINRLYKIPTAQSVAAGKRAFEPYPKPLFRAELRTQPHLGRG